MYKTLMTVKKNQKGKAVKVKSHKIKEENTIKNNKLVTGTSWLQKIINNIMSFIGFKSKKIEPSVKNKNSAQRRSRAEKKLGKLALMYGSSKIVSLSSLITFGISSTVPKNAEREIKKANKILAKNYLSKMLSRPGTGSDKTKIGEDANATSDAYIVGVTSYSVPDAALTANVIAGKEYHKRMIQLMLMDLIVKTIVMLLNKQYSRIVITLASSIISMHYKEYITGLTISSLINPTSIATKILCTGLGLSDYYKLFTNPIKKMVTAFTVVLGIILIILR